MSYQEPAQLSMAQAGSRSAFIMRTYNHLLGAILAFIGVEVLLFKSGVAQVMAQKMLGVNWLFVLGGFILVSWLASRFAHRATSLPVQYAALGGFVVAEAIIFVPLLYIAQYYAGGGVIETAAFITLIGFGGLTAIVFFTRKDFSFLRTLLMWGGFGALGLIVTGVVIGFNLGPIFSIAMVTLAGAAILYDTSNILHHFPEDRYVAGALELFASVAMMFWYVLQLVMSRD